MNDLISRGAAIRWVKTECNPYGKPTIDFESGKKVIEHLENMPPAEPEVTEEAVKGLCICDSVMLNKYASAKADVTDTNVGDISGYCDRLWRNAYERGKRDAQPEIIRCKDCKHYVLERGDASFALGWCPFIKSHLVMSKGFCAWAERSQMEE